MRLNGWGVQPVSLGTLLSVVISQSPGARSSACAANAKTMGISNKTMSVFFMVAPLFLATLPEMVIGG